MWPMERDFFPIQLEVHLMRLWLTGSWRGGQSQRLDLALFELKALFSTCQTIKKYTLKKCLVRSSWEDEFIVNMVQVCLILAARPSQYDAILSKPILCWKTSAFYFGMIRELMWRKTNKWLFLTSEKGDMLSFCSLMSYLIFVTDSRTVSAEKKSVEKSKIHPHVD